LLCVKIGWIGVKILLRFIRYFRLIIVYSKDNLGYIDHILNISIIDAKEIFRALFNGTKKIVYRIYIAINDIQVFSFFFLPDLILSFILCIKFTIFS
jgi:hypothetical protein